LPPAEPQPGQTLHNSLPVRQPILEARVPPVVADHDFRDIDNSNQSYSRHPCTVSMLCQLAWNKKQRRTRRRSIV
jgi:hypothetical protein